MDLAAVDELLTTTRAVRKRLDLHRAVPPEVIEECLALAIQAPTGANAQRWRFVVVTDVQKRAALAGIYRRVWERYEVRQLAALSSLPAERAAPLRRVLDSSRYLAENLHRVPVHVVPCALGRVDEPGGSAEWAGFLGSIFPAVWSFQLALRSRGLGSVLTTLHLYGEAEAAKILDIPDTVTQVALLPVAYSTGDGFKPADRRPAAQITYWNTWKSPRDVSAR
jgi:nitroreductase